MVLKVLSREFRFRIASPAGPGWHKAHTVDVVELRLHHVEMLDTFNTCGPSCCEQRLVKINKAPCTLDWLMDSHPRQVCVCVCLYQAMAYGGGVGLWFEHSEVK